MTHLNLRAIPYGIASLHALQEKRAIFFVGAAPVGGGAVLTNSVKLRTKLPILQLDRHNFFLAFFVAQHECIVG